MIEDPENQTAGSVAPGVPTAMAQIPATVIIDTQNVYGSTGEVLGGRIKAVPAGVRDAFGALGYAVEQVIVAVARPDGHDERGVWLEVTGQDRTLGSLKGELQRLSKESLPAAAVNQVLGALQGVVKARAVLGAASPSSGQDRLGRCHEASSAALDELTPSKTCVDLAMKSVCNTASHSASSRVPAGWVLAMADLLTSSQRLENCLGALRRCGSYTYAARSNVDYLKFLEHTSDSRLQVLEGRFRLGRDGDDPGEKQVDTICAIACVEAVRAALEAARPASEARAVIVVSDDDDMTPALRYCAALTHNTSVSVIAAGTAVLNRRYASQPLTADRPAWLCLDSSAWCRIAGLDPIQVIVQKKQFASLVLGNGAVFTVGKGHAETRLGVHGPALGAVDGQQVLRASRLKWGPGARRAVPNMVLSARGARTPLGVTCRARRAFHTKLSVLKMPIDVNGTLVDADLGAPGWWMAGSELVAVEVETASGRVMWRIIGPHPDHPDSTVESRSAEIIAVGDTFASASDGETTWRCFAPPQVGLAVGDRVVVWPYERAAKRANPQQPRSLPRGVLLSSAL